MNIYIIYISYMSHKKLKYTIDLNIKWKPQKLLEGDIGVNLSDIAFGDTFLDITPETLSTKGKIDVRLH